jgi:glycosyltransferase involved in cell wall biosynthesis
MKVALGMIEKNEIMFLKRHLHLLSPHFDGIIVADANSTDGSIEYLTDMHATIVQQVDPNIEAQGEHRNQVVREAEAQGFDWLLMLDSDEMMFPEAIEDAKRFMEAPENEFLAFPRIEFYGDVNHYRPNLYPDYQGRAIRLNMGYHWRNPIHELVYKGNEESSAFETGHLTVVPSAHIYHYGWALARERRYLRYENRERNIRGEKLLADVGYNMPDLLLTPGIKVYYGKQPV